VALQEYKGPWFGKRRLLCAAANAYLLEDRYREAAVLFSYVFPLFLAGLNTHSALLREAIQSAVLNRDEESVLWASIGVIHCLCRSGDLQAAQQIIHEVLPIRCLCSLSSLSPLSLSLSLCCATHHDLLVGG
jgi:hypothetical protein